MKKLQNNHLVYEQLKMHLKKEIVIREEILSLLKQDHSDDLASHLSPLLKTLKSAHKQKQALIKKMVQFSPLSIKEIPLHSIIDVEDECELDLLSLMKKKYLLKEQIIRRNGERKTWELFEKTFIPEVKLEVPQVAKKTKTLSIETQEEL